MAEMKFTVKVVERESEIFGLPASDMMMLVLFVIICFMAPMMLDVAGIKCGFWYYMTCFALVAVFFRVLKKFSKKGSNQFFSYISLKLIQPKIVKPAVVEFELRKDTPEKERDENNKHS